MSLLSRHSGKCACRTAQWLLLSPYDLQPVATTGTYTCIGLHWGCRGCLCGAAAPLPCCDCILRLARSEARDAHGLLVLRCSPTAPHGIKHVRCLSTVMCACRKVQKLSALCCSPTAGS